MHNARASSFQNQGWRPTPSNDRKFDGADPIPGFDIPNWTRRVYSPGFEIQAPGFEINILLILPFKIRIRRLY